jgi:hypothetical protein
MPDHDVFDHESAASRSAKPRCGKGELEPPHAVSLGPGHIGAIRLWYPPFADEVGTDGEVRVHRIICAIDCGVAVNPEMIAAQVEGETLFGLTAALYGQITLKNERVEQGNFHDYRSMRMNEAPSIETYLVKEQRSPRRLWRSTDRVNRSCGSANRSSHLACRDHVRALRTCVVRLALPWEIDLPRGSRSP